MTDRIPHHFGSMQMQLEMRRTDPDMQVLVAKVREVTANVLTSKPAACGIVVQKNSRYQTRFCFCLFVDSRGRLEHNQLAKIEQVIFTILPKG